MKNANTFLFLLFLLFGCQSSTDQSSAEETLPYFDLKNYFQEEKKRLAEGSNFSKTTAVNQKKEVKQVETLNFGEELRIFQKSDINRPAWHGKYQIDSVFQNQQLEAITYTSLDSDLEIKSIEVNFTNKEVSKIKIERKLETALADTDYRLVYEPQKGYQINNSQEMKIGETQFFEVKVDF